jgi:hypothetical protein
MATTAIESVLQQFKALSPNEQRELRNLISGRSTTNGEAVNARPNLKFDPKDEASMRWMIANEYLYRGEWIALDGDRLISHGSDYAGVAAAAKADSAELPLIYFAEPEPERPFLRV